MAIHGLYKVVFSLKVRFWKVGGDRRVLFRSDGQKDLQRPPIRLLTRNLPLFDR